MPSNTSRVQTIQILRQHEVEATNELVGAMSTTGYAYADALDQAFTEGQKSVKITVREVGTGSIWRIPPDRTFREP